MPIGPRNRKNSPKVPPILRAVLEIGFIIFLFYSNLLMGEFTRSGQGQAKGLLWALGDIFTKTNLLIAVILALVGYLIIEFFRRRL